MREKTTILFILIFFFTINLQAQEIIKHVVKKGETAYSLSKLYNVDIVVIYKHNPESENVIRIGETLSFPKEDKSAQSTKFENGYLIHWVSRGETKIGLSRRYNISIPQLEELNPHIIPMLQAGHKLRILANDLITVKPGETLYGISKRYGMTVEELVSANADRIQGILKSGQSLYVGKKGKVTSIEKNNGPYIVKTGDTKSSLSKKFGISIAELERLNPHIVPMLKIDDVIQTSEQENNISTPKSKEKTEKEQVAEKPQSINQNNLTSEPTKSGSEKYVDYTIQPKETLFGLSKRAGMTYEEFIALNPQLNSGVQIGMIIKMPEDSIPQTIAPETTITQTTQADNNPTPKREETSNVTEADNTLLSTLQKNSEKTLLFITPFSESELKNLNGSSEGLDKNLKIQVDFLNGAQLAIEKAKSEGLKLKVQFLKSTEIKNKIKQKTDAIIFTSSTKEDAELLKAYGDPKIPIIATQQNYYLNTENVFNALPSVEFERKTILDHLKKQNGKVIVVQDQESPELTKVINEYYPTAQYITATANGDINGDELKNSLSVTDMNFVIMNSTKNIIVLTATTALLEKVADHKIQLVILENNKIPDSEKVSKTRLTILKMLYPSADISSKKSTAFIEEYTSKNNRKPSDQVVKGYDVTIDTALRLFQPKSFRETAETVKSEQLITEFDYKKDESGSCSNHGINIMQYGENGIVKISENTK